jgi:hypothetical protein
MRELMFKIWVDPEHRWASRWFTRSWGATFDHLADYLAKTNN